jgi:hypothetical protein
VVSRYLKISAPVPDDVARTVGEARPYPYRIKMSNVVAIMIISAIAIRG